MFQQVIDSIGFQMEAPMDALTIGSTRKTKTPGQSKYHYYGLNRISPTVTGQFPKQYAISTGKMKELPIRVFSALQTFPSDYDFGSYSIKDTRQMIGNSVPPAMSQIIMTIAMR
jgi:site-specific DNA-cytosine methylase